MKASNIDSNIFTQISKKKTHPTKNFYFHLYSNYLQPKSLISRSSYYLVFNFDANERLAGFYNEVKIIVNVLMQTQYVHKK